MTTKEEYTASLRRLFKRAMGSKSVESTHNIQKERVACIVAVTTLKDELEAEYGKGKIPLEALLACSDFMKLY